MPAYVIVVKFIHVVKFIGGGGIMSTLQKFKGDYVHLYKNEKGVCRGVGGGTFVLHSVE